MPSTYLFFRYISYFLNAVDEHSLQAPFVYQLYTSVIKADKRYYAFDKIEKYRTELLHDDRELMITDLGAGSRVSNSKVRKISSISRSGLSNRKFSRLLFRLIDHMKSEHVLELGTSLGINTLYMANAGKQVSVTTFEGCTETAEVAKGLFEKAEATNISLVQGNIDNNLVKYLNSHTNIDLVYFDANHRYQPTISYFKLCLPYINEKSIFIFDDIHWSKEMNKAWEEIKLHPMVTLSIDLFDAGIVFFRKELSKEHYVLTF
ncbi:class I SAM-dependent methyltransferase [Fulvivirgaceae bacterium BMA10]|uniref:Class I SAM-dependent methyltransferase n=1 Tax=Splendidivirga corallicola TaxID=3051826 RepID=A0ABT8KGX2_9BACT|nr:class I SAM-dependent methyltransferase [Fulvivirgaceae bacterium BMA10]